METASAINIVKLMMSLYYHVITNCVRLVFMCVVMFMCVQKTLYDHIFFWGGGSGLPPLPRGYAPGKCSTGHLIQFDLSVVYWLRES